MFSEGHVVAELRQVLSPFHSAGCLGVVFGVSGLLLIDMFCLLLLVQCRWQSFKQEKDFNQVSYEDMDR